MVLLCFDSCCLHLLIFNVDGKGFGAGWFLDNVVITDNTEKKSVFNCGRWLDKGEGDGLTIRDLAPENDGTASNVAVVKYRITVHTGDKRGAGKSLFTVILIDY